LPELGIGFYPVTAQPYDARYWKNYCKLDATPIGALLTEMRCDWVEQQYAGDLVDIGIGGGRFVSSRPQTFGYDVNPCAVKWLKEQQRWRDPYQSSVAAISCWDSLEHIHDPGPLLDNVRQWVFVSLPIFRDVAHVIRSKHFKRDEHCWYMTREGVIRFMAWFGFQIVARGTMEQQAGREDIESFAFRRFS